MHVTGKLESIDVSGYRSAVPLTCDRLYHVFEAYDSQTNERSSVKPRIAIDVETSFKRWQAEVVGARFSHWV